MKVNIRKQENIETKYRSRKKEEMDRENNVKEVIGR